MYVFTQTSVMKNDTNTNEQSASQDNKEKVKQHKDNFTKHDKFHNYLRKEKHYAVIILREIAAIFLPFTYVHINS